MDLNIKLQSLKHLEESDLKVDSIKFQKMILLYNSIEQGWTIKKRNDSYVFIKNSESKKEVIQDSYLLNFMKDNLDINKISNTLKKDVYPFYINLESGSDHGFQHLVEKNENKHLTHYMYAGQWFLFTLVGIIFLIIKSNLSRCSLILYPLF